MKIKEAKYTHKVTLLHPNGKQVTRYTNKPDDRAIVLMENGYSPLEGEKTITFTANENKVIEPISAPEPVDVAVDTVSDTLETA
jgi:hypothetical protein